MRRSKVVRRRLGSVRFDIVDVGFGCDWYTLSYIYVISELSVDVSFFLRCARLEAFPSLRISQLFLQRRAHLPMYLLNSLLVTCMHILSHANKVDS